MPAPLRPACALLAAWLSACVAGSADRVSDLAPQPCDAELGNGARCYSLSLPENHEAPDGRRISLAVAVVPAKEEEERAQSDPVLVLLGGPGDAASFHYGALLREHAAINETRPLVFVDQRGTGRSSPLSCGLGGSDDDVQPYLDEFQAPDAPERCRRKLGPDVDLSRYRTTDFIADLEIVRRALGVEQWNLHGGSYGTRVAQQYMARHPHRIRSAVLIGVEAQSQIVPMTFAHDVEAALDSLTGQCARDAECHKAFPSFRRELDAVAGRLERGPVPGTIAHPVTGRLDTIPFSRHAFNEAIRFSLYSPQNARHLPLRVHQAFQGNYLELATMHMRRQRNIAHQGWQGLYLAVTCAEDIARVDTAALYANATGSFYGVSRSRQHVAACRSWPVNGHDVWPASDRITTPVLMIVGDMDPATPLSGALEAQRAMTSSRVIVVPTGAHGFGGMTNVGCLYALQAAFYERPEPAALDASCVASVRRLPFFTTR
jgi:pimeloyl-ACP methyl ester carboxylesterase